MKDIVLLRVNQVRNSHKQVKQLKIRDYGQFRRDKDNEQAVQRSADGTFPETAGGALPESGCRADGNGKRKE